MAPHFLEDLAQGGFDVARHVLRVAAHVDARALRDPLVEFVAVVVEAVLYVGFGLAVSRQA